MLMALIVRGRDADIGAPQGSQEGDIFKPEIQRQTAALLPGQFMSVALDKYDADLTITIYDPYRHKLIERGKLLPDYWADVVIFSPSDIKDQATYQNTYRESDGIAYVMVNGKMEI